MGVKPATKGPAISRDDPGQADLARESPPRVPTVHDCATHPADACLSGALATVALDYLTSAAGTHECRPASAALQPGLLNTSTNLKAPPNPVTPRIPGKGHAPQAPAIYQCQLKGRGPRYGPIIPPDLPFPQAGHEADQEVQANTPDPRAHR